MLIEVTKNNYKEVSLRLLPGKREENHGEKIEKDEKINTHTLVQIYSMHSVRGTIKVFPLNPNPGLQNADALL